MKPGHFLTYLFILPAVLLLLCSCSSVGSYQSKQVYSKPLVSDIAKKSMAYEGIERNPVIVIHGFLGARLENCKTRDCIWGDFKGIEVLEGYSQNHLQQLSHPMAIGKPLKALKDQAVAVSILGKFNVRILGLSFQIDAYNNLISILQQAGYVPDNRPKPKDKQFNSLFTFYYDWRRDLPENAARLEEFIATRKTYLQRRYKKLYNIDNYDVQFDIIAHSMGGLLSRYYLRYGGQDLPADGSMPILDWRGSKNIDKLVIVGTPNAGYLDTCLELVNGLRIDPGAPLYPPAVVGTFPTYYQMLPLTSTRSVILPPDNTRVDLFDINNWLKYKWGLANPTQDNVLKVLLPKVKNAEKRREIALDHLQKCLKRAKQFTEAMRIPANPPDDVALLLFAGDAVPTHREATVDPQTGKLTVTRLDAGDGKVLASSARMDERAGQQWTPFMSSPINWQACFFLKAAHMGITDSYTFADNVLFYLLEFPTASQQKRIRRRKVRQLLRNNRIN